MTRRWPWRVAYALAALLQSAVLVAAAVLYQLSQTKMGVMRYLVAQNVTLEAGLFSPASVLVQTGVLLALGIGAAVLALVMLRRRAWFAAAQSLVLCAFAEAGVWLATSVSIDDVWALYALIAAVWAVIALEALVVAVSVGRALRRGAAEPATSGTASPS